MINYLNHATQSLNVAADVVGRENSTLASLLRTIASSRAVAADRFLTLMVRSQKNPVTGNKFSILKCPALPKVILSDDTIDEVVKILQEFVQAEKTLSMLDSKAFTYSYVTEQHTVQSIQDGARTAALLIERIVHALENGDRGPYYCTNCLERHEQREQCACGMSPAFLTCL